MNLITKLSQTKRYIEKKMVYTPRVGVVLGSGLSNVLGELTRVKRFSYTTLPHFPSTSVHGHAGELVFGMLGQTHVVVMKGRPHLYEGYSLEEVTYPVRLLKLLGVQELIVTAAAGGINPRYRQGDIIVLKDFINLMGNNPLSGSHYAPFGERFVDMHNVFDSRLRKRARTIYKKNKIVYREGVYIAVKGPSYETPAEIRAFRRLGADMVGMSVVPETIVARQMGVEVVGLSYIANTCSGHATKALLHKDVVAAGTHINKKIGRIVKDIIIDQRSKIEC